MIMDPKEARNIVNSARQQVAGVRTHFESVGRVTPEGLQKLADIERTLADHEASFETSDEETRAAAAPVKASKGQAEPVK